MTLAVRQFVAPGIRSLEVLTFQGRDTALQKDARQLEVRHREIRIEDERCAQRRFGFRKIASGVLVNRSGIALQRLGRMCRHLRKGATGGDLSNRLPQSLPHLSREDVKAGQQAAIGVDVGALHEHQAAAGVECAHGDPQAGGCCLDGRR